MQTQLDRAELVSRLLADLDSSGADPLLVAFARTLLRKVDDNYLFRHRLTTLGAQIRDSFTWFLPAIAIFEMRGLVPAGPARPGKKDKSAH